MNLKENKEITLALIEEFNPTSDFLTDDDDIRIRINQIYNTCMMNAARNKRIEKDYKFEDYKKSDKDYYQEFDLPEDYYIIRDIVIQDTKTNSIKGNQVDFYRIGKKIYVNTNSECEGIPILRYYAYPKVIEKNDTDEKYEFDLDLDIQYLLPYSVASDILKIDKSADYTAFENKYRTELSSLTTIKEESRSFISGGYDI